MYHEVRQITASHAGVKRIRGFHCKCWRTVKKYEIFNSSTNAESRANLEVGLGYALYQSRRDMNDMVVEIFTYGRDYQFKPIDKQFFKTFIKTAEPGNEVSDQFKNSKEPFSLVDLPNGHWGIGGLAMDTYGALNPSLKLLCRTNAMKFGVLYWEELATATFFHSMGNHAIKTIEDASDVMRLLDSVKLFTRLDNKFAFDRQFYENRINEQLKELSQLESDIQAEVKKYNYAKDIFQEYGIPVTDIQVNKS